MKERSKLFPFVLLQLPFPLERLLSFEIMFCSSLIITLFVAPYQYAGFSLVRDLVLPYYSLRCLRFVCRC